MVPPDDQYEDPPETADYGDSNPEDEGVQYEQNPEGYSEGEGEHAQEGQDEAMAEGMLPSINLPITVALGRSYMSIKEILKLRPGQILELNKNPNEPVDLIVNGKVVARGELVDVEGRLAVRLIKIVE